MDERKHYRICAKVWEVFGWSAVVLALLGMAGLVVSLIMLGLGNEHVFQLAIACGSFAGAALLFGSGGYLCLRAGEKYRTLELDATERADSEESFFVGEGTLATFAEGGLEIHGEGGKRVSVPYGAIRLFSVCTRPKPKEKGAWSVLIEVPAVYLLKKAKPEEPPVLIQAEGKKRLYDTLHRRGLSLLGEPPAERPEKKKFTLLKKFNLPDKAKRKRALLFLLLGAVLAGGGVGLCFYKTVIGAPVIVVGGYILLRAVFSYWRAKRVLGVYREGLYLSELTSRESFFLKWEEMENLVPAEAEGKQTLRANCPYGAYDFPRPEGAYEYLEERFPDKCGK